MPTMGSKIWRRSGQRIDGLREVQTLIIASAASQRS
jgi:hypothetical protein